MLGIASDSSFLPRHLMEGWVGSQPAGTSASERTELRCAPALLELTVTQLLPLHCHDLTPDQIEKGERFGDFWQGGSPRLYKTNSKGTQRWSQRPSHFSKAELPPHHGAICPSSHPDPILNLQAAIRTLPVKGIAVKLLPSITSTFDSLDFQQSRLPTSPHLSALDAC